VIRANSIAKNPHAFYGRWRRAFCTSAAAVVTALIALPGAALAAPSAEIDFDDPGYVLGPGHPNGENGWVGTGTDWGYALVENSVFPASGMPGNRSLRVDNAVVPGTRYLRTPRIDPAGEPGLPGVTANTFEGEFTVGSATGGKQEGLLLEVVLDSASRYGGVLSLRHTAAGLEIGSLWLPHSATDAANASWRSEILATVDPSRPHHIRARAQFLTGAPDILSVWVDDVLVSGCTGLSTWEHYYTVTGAATDHHVDELSFRLSTSAPSGTGTGYVTGLPPAPATAGLGYLFGDIAFRVFDSVLPSPGTPPIIDPVPDSAPNQPLAIRPAALTTSGGLVSVTAGGFQPGEQIYAALYPEGTLAGWATAGDDGSVNAGIDIPAATASGPHQLQLTGATSGCTALGSLSISADPGPPAVAVTLPVTGADLRLLPVAAVLLLTGSVLLLTAQRQPQ
jgi:hypothetical protein